MIKLLVLMCLATLPVYSFESGGLQISHIFIIIIFIYSAASNELKIRDYEVICILLSAYVLIRESIDVYVFGVGFDGLMSVLYTIFPLIILFSFGRYEFSESNNRFFVLGLFLSIAVSLIGIYKIGASFTIDEGNISRTVGTFNNPNQLAYYSVCMMSIFSLFFLKRIIGKAYFLIGMGLLVILSLLSLSKAGMIATILPVCLGILALNRDRRPSFVTLSMFALLSAAFLIAYLGGALDDLSFVQRLDQIGTAQDDNLSARGYGVIFDAGGLYVVFGLAQQGVLYYLGHEVHSTIFSYVSNYGLIGGGLFLWLLWKWGVRVLAEHGWIGVLLIVLPPMLYGITHNGSRFSVFWILVALSFASFSAARPVSDMQPN